MEATPTGVRRSMSDPKSLTRNVASLLNDGDTAGRFNCKPWALAAALVTGMESAGWTENDVQAAFSGDAPGVRPVVEAWGEATRRKVARLYRKAQANRAWHDETIARLDIHAQERRLFKGRTGATDHRVYLALLDVARQAGTLEVNASLRQLGELAGVGGVPREAPGHKGPAERWRNLNTKTVQRATGRLVAAGLLVKVSGNDGNRAATWRLVVPREVDVELHDGWPRVHTNDPTSPRTSMYARTNGGVSVHQFPETWRSPAWERRALGQAACVVWHTLRTCDKPTSLEELAERTGLHRNTVRKALYKLDECYLVAGPGPVHAIGEKQGPWVALDRDLFDVEDDLGVLHRDGYRRAGHQAQRDAFNVYLQGGNRRLAPPNIDPETGEVLAPAC